MKHETRKQQNAVFILYICIFLNVAQNVASGWQNG